MTTAGALQSVFRAPIDRRTWAELLYVAVGVPLGAVVFVPVVVAYVVGTRPRATFLVAVLIGSLLVAGGVLVARRLAALHRDLARALLGERVGAPALRQRRMPGVIGWLEVCLHDPANWRAAAYLVLKSFLALVGAFVITMFWISGVIYLFFPVAHVLGFLGSYNSGAFWLHYGLARWLGMPGVVSLAGSFGVATLGIAALAIAPWATRAVVLIDEMMVRGLLGPRTLSDQIRTLQEARARVVDGSAAQLRQIERDLHDGAQVRLATLAMTIGMIKENLDPSNGPVDLAATRALVETAHGHSKEALVELRNLARGIHPPALDTGLDAALATLASTSALPVSLNVDVPTRPSAAIETIAYFCTAELLANAAKHSHAQRAAVDVTARKAELYITVTDTGIGGARIGAAGGLAGLRDRVHTVDGDLRIVSPVGGPTVVTIELPRHP